MEKRRAIIAPSILAADFSRLAEEVKAVEKAGADWIHCDVMDGHFVPNITIGPMVVEAVKKSTILPLDVHLMIENPSRYAGDFISAGADIITVHVETCPHLHRDIQHIREMGAKAKKNVRAGVSLNPHTPLTMLEHIINDIDMALVMTVNPGFGGQNFIRSCISKINELAGWIKDEGLDVDIEVDGGITLGNVEEASVAGANVFVAGTTIFKSPDYKKTITQLRQKLK